MKKNIFTGVATALITPFTKTRVDYESFEKIINFQLNSGVNALVFLGTTGEAPTVTYYEYEKIIDFAISKVAKKVPVIIGAGSNSTEIAIKKAKLCKKYEADGVLCVTPYYNKCTQSGLIKHYREINDKADIPIIAYNVPSRTGVDISPKTLEELCNIENVYGIKDAGGNLSKTKKTFALIRNKISLYSGDDLLNLDMYKVGAVGSISVVSNAVPKSVLSVYNKYASGDAKGAKLIHNKLQKLTNLLFCEVNPIPIKALMSYLNFCENNLRLPLTELSKNNLRNLICEYEKFNSTVNNDNFKH